MGYGWVVVACGFAVALFGWGLGFYGPGVYLAALHARHGWPMSLIASAVTVYYLASATWIIFAGDAIERFGARRIVMSCAGFMALGVALLPAAAAPWHVFVAFGVMSFGWAGMSGAAVNALVAPWFDEKRGLAISLALNGSSCGGIFVTPLIVYLIERFGFATGVRLAAAGMLVLMVPIALALRRPPSHGSRARVAPLNRAEIARTRAFLTLAIPFALGLLAQVGLLTHQVSYLLRFFETQAAAFAVSLTTIAAVTARTLTGLFIDRLDPRAVCAGNFAVQIAGLAVLLGAESPPPVYLGWIVFGLGVGNLVTLPSIVVQAEFPREAFSRVISLIIGLNQFTFAFGPAILGALRDWSGDYRAAFGFCMALQGLAAGIVLAGRRRS